MTTPNRGRLACAVLLALGASGATVSPAFAAPATVTVADDTFAPAAVTIDAGESVTWDFKESSHNAYSDDGWQVNKGFATGTYSKTFDAAGTFKYYCQAHPEMKGTVTVNAAPAAPAAPAEQPAPGQPAPDASAPTAGAAAATPAAWSFPAAQDLAAPRAAGLRAVARRGRAVVRVKLNEDAALFVSVRRAGARRAVRTVRVRGRRGVNRVRMGRALRAGRYRVRVVAIDASGNESRIRSTALRVKK